MPARISYTTEHISCDPPMMATMFMHGGSASTHHRKKRRKGIWACESVDDSRYTSPKKQMMHGTTTSRAVYCSGSVSAKYSARWKTNRIPLHPAPLLGPRDSRP